MEKEELTDEVMEYFKTMVSVERIAIAGLLALEKKSLSLVEIASRTGISPVAAVRHIDRLQAAGIVRQEREQYELDGQKVENLARRALAGHKPRVDPESLEGDAYDRKVLADFLLPNGRLKTIPAQEKKLKAVLRHLVKSFQPGEEYPEKMVNEILKRAHDDSASLRRALIDYGFMSRENSVYVRIRDEIREQ